jgi:Janus/Ocnus family (Ocnus)
LKTPLPACSCFTGSLFRFAAVLIEVVCPKGDKQLVVRGFKSAFYHNDVFTASKSEIKAALPGAIVECKGGGRITHRAPGSEVEVDKDDEDAGVERPRAVKELCACKCPSIAVFGHSLGFGRADHSLAVEALRNHFSSYPPENIQFFNEGY